jgi:type I restriction enzyme M protein
MGIVLPDGILSNPGTEYIRYWILQNAWVLASIDLPVEIFIVDANVNILTSLLFLKKKTAEEMRAESLGGMVEYPVFMAVAEKVGFDRRGNKLYKREPDGEEKIVLVKEETVYVQIDGRMKPRPRRKYDKVLDDDLPEISRKYREFREHYPEPGS